MSPREQSEKEPTKSYHKILEQEIESGVKELERPAGALFTSGLSAGLDIGFSILMVAVMQELVEGRLPEPIGEILVANMYAVGLVFVVLGRSELFTEHTTLAVLPVLDGRAGIAALGRLWGLIYVSNQIGTSLFAAFAVAVAPALEIASRETFGEIAEGLVDHPSWVMLASGILAGWLMGLLSWLVIAARETISQIFVVWMIAVVIGLAHLHHSVIGGAEVLAGLFAGQGITAVDYLRFLAWTTLGNALGGVFLVALLKYGHVKQG